MALTGTNQRLDDYGYIISSFSIPHFKFCDFHVKPWPNGLASQRCVSFGHPLALTLVELKFVRQGDASFSPFGHPNESRHKLIASQLYMRENYDFNDMRELASRLTNSCLATHRKSVRKSWKIQLHSPLKKSKHKLLFWLGKAKHT